MNWQLYLAIWKLYVPNYPNRCCNNDTSQPVTTKNPNSLMSRVAKRDCTGLVCTTEPVRSWIFKNYQIQGSLNCDDVQKIIFFNVRIRRGTTNPIPGAKY
jgi:hypothetical protein